MSDVLRRTSGTRNGASSQQLCGKHSASAGLTILAYLSIGEGSSQQAVPSSGVHSLAVPPNATFAARCILVGVGCEGDGAVAALAAAPWFLHLHRSMHRPLRVGGQQAAEVLDGMIGQMGHPHVVSLALPRQPGPVEVDLACAVGRLFRERKAFAVATVSQPSGAAMARLGGAFDCVIQGDGSIDHHLYPPRTVTEPAGGRLVCYDLYDVCTLWAGRIGFFGQVVPTADGLHVEISAEIDSLAEVDRIADEMAAGLDKPERLRLFNVVPGARPDATAVSFLNSRVVQQARGVVRSIGG